MPLLRERLNAGQQVRFAPMGTSMLPMLHPGRDSVKLQAVSGPLKKYDLPFYQRPDGAYVLHRVVRTGAQYLCAGDNQFQTEPVAPEQIIAKVISFTRNGRECSVDVFSYRLYCRAWHATRLPRRLWRALRARIRRGSA